MSAKFAVRSNSSPNSNGKRVRYNPSYIVPLSLACRIVSSPSYCPSLSVAVWLNFLPLLPRLRLMHFWRNSSSLCPKLRLNLSVNGRHRLFSPGKSQHYSSSSRWRLQVPLAVCRPWFPRPNQVGDYGAPFVAKIDDARISTRVNIDCRSQQSIVDHGNRSTQEYQRELTSIVDHNNRLSITVIGRRRRSQQRSSIIAIDRRSQQSIVDHSNRSSITATDRRSITNID